MIKVAANYLVTDTGLFLKNGIALVSEEEFINEYIDTKGDLREMEQLIFYNGILMGGFMFTKTESTQMNGATDSLFKGIVIQSVRESTQLTLHNLIDLGKQLQIKFPEIKIPEIINEIVELLIGEGGFIKETLPGIYLLSGVDLVGLHFTPKSRLKQII